MSDNVLIAIIAASGVVISAVMVLGAGIAAVVVNNKRLDKIEGTLVLIQTDIRELKLILRWNRVDNH